MTSKSTGHYGFSIVVKRLDKWQRRKKAGSKNLGCVVSFTSGSADAKVKRIWRLIGQKQYLNRKRI